MFGTDTFALLKIFLVVKFRVAADRMYSNSVVYSSTIFTLYFEANVHSTFIL